MSGKHVNAHAVFGDTNRADSVPDCLVPQDGPVYLEGRLVLSLSFQGGPANVKAEDAGELIERFRLWDDLADKWHNLTFAAQRGRLPYANWANDRFSSDIPCGGTA